MRMNWTRARDRERMHRHGAECVSGDDLILSLLPRRPRPRQPSKAELREWGAVAVREWRARGDGAALPVPQIRKAGI
jgi:hypothetical protein